MRVVVLALVSVLPLAAQSAVLRIGGDVPTKLTLTTGELAKMPRQSATVAEHEGGKATYEGVSLRDLLNRAGAPLDKQLRGKMLASYLIAKAKDGYRVVFTLPELDAAFANEPVFVADKRDGKALSDSQGPFRLVWPNDKVAARSIRMLESVELVKIPQ